MLTLTILFFFFIHSFPIEDPQGMVLDILFYDDVQNEKCAATICFMQRTKKKTDKLVS